MSATFSTGPVTFGVIEAVAAHRLVQVTETGVKHADPGKAAFGAVAYAAAPPDPDRPNILPAHVAVYASPAVVVLDVDGEDTTIKAGASIEVGRDGKAKAHASGAVVAVATRAASGGKVDARLLTPVTAK